ncbi:MAG: hypothetical protein U9P00_06235, partial [Pseudomonadota bacterium]|nr:hypothetical protein [Pseudomonadota bacterium]
MAAGKQAETGPETSRVRPALRPPGSRLGGDASTVAGYRWVWIALATVLLLGLAVIFLLPQLVSRYATPTLQERPLAQGQAPTR